MSINVLLLLTGAPEPQFLHEVESAKRSDLILDGNVIVPLFPIADDGRTLLQTWLDEVASSPRVNLATDVYIATDPQKYPYILPVARSCGLNERNVHIVKSLRSGGHVGPVGELQGLGAVLPHIDPSRPLVVLDATTCCPDFSFTRIVEHAIIRQRDAVAVIRPKPGPILALEGPTAIEVTPLDGSEVNPKITDVRPGAASASSKLLMAPCVVLQPASLAHAAQYVLDHGPHGTLGSLVAALSAGGKDLFGSVIGHVLPLSTFKHFNFARQYLEIRTSRATSLDALAQGAPSVVESLRQSESDLLEFQEVFLRRVAAADKVAAGEMPSRFTDPHLWHNSTRRMQHPCYSTTSSMYGAKLPSQQELPLVYHPVLHTDVTTITHPGTGKPRFTGFVTSRIYSHVHSELDEF